MYILKRCSDGVGDSGGMSDAIFIDVDDTVRVEHNARPRLGARMRIGSTFARSYSHQDYWTMTPITEIIDDSPNYVKFRTSNSVYEWIIV
jgi:hypothetical protein